MPALTIAQASPALGLSQDTIRRRLKSGDIPGSREKCPGGFRWLVDVSPMGDRVSPIGDTEETQATPPPAGGTPNGGIDLVELLKSQLDAKDEQIGELHRMAMQTSLNSAPDAALVANQQARIAQLEEQLAKATRPPPWWRFWG